MWGRGTKRKTLHSACTSGPYSLWHLFHLCPSLPPFPARLQLGLGFVHRRHLVRGPHLPGLTRCVQRPEPAQRLGACARLMTRVMAQVARVAPACHSKVSGLNTYIPKGPLDNEHQERQVLELDHAVRIPGSESARFEARCLGDRDRCGERRLWRFRTARRSLHGLSRFAPVGVVRRTFALARSSLSCNFLRSAAALALVGKNLLVRRRVWPLRTYHSNEPSAQSCRRT